jgi:hypothetical protein
VPGIDGEHIAGNGMVAELKPGKGSSTYTDWWGIPAGRPSPRSQWIQIRRSFAVWTVFGFALLAGVPGIDGEHIAGNGMVAELKPGKGNTPFLNVYGLVGHTRGSSVSQVSVDSDPSQFRGLDPRVCPASMANISLGMGWLPSLSPEKVILSTMISCRTSAAEPDQSDSYFPIWGEEARARGYSIPLPYGALTAALTPRRMISFLFSCVVINPNRH